MDRPSIDIPPEIDIKKESGDIDKNTDTTIKPKPLSPQMQDLGLDLIEEPDDDPGRDLIIPPENPPTDPPRK